MTEYEHRKALVAWIHERKIRAYEYARSFVNLPAEQLKHYGHKTREDAIINVFKLAEKEIEERIRSHERMYPSGK